MTKNDQGVTREGLAAQLRSIQALMIRDMMLRYGRNNIGFLWVVLEPMILTAGVLVIFSSVKSTYEHGTHVVALVLTGYMPLTLWRHTTNNGVFLLRRSASILYHRKLTLLDTFLARMGLELIGTTTAFMAVYGLLFAAGIIQAIDDVGTLIVAWLMLGFLGAGLSLVFAALTEYAESSERFIQPFQYLLVPLSGIFFMVDWLPTTAQNLIWFNPMTHCIEMFRAGFFGEYIGTYYDAWYPLAWVFLLWALGLFFLDLARQRFSAG
jgi:capsular polysaccharide transport system permease protein